MSRPGPYQSAAALLVTLTVAASAVAAPPFPPSLAPRPPTPAGAAPAPAAIPAAPTTSPAPGAAPGATSVGTAPAAPSPAPPSGSPSASPSGAGIQRAPSAEEQRAFNDGLRLFQAGDPRGAERAWKQGHAIAGDPAFLIRIGEAQERAGAPKEAARTYEQYLRASPTAADREEIETRLRGLDPQSRLLANPGSRAPLDENDAVTGTMGAPPGTAGAQGSPPGAAAAREGTGPQAAQVADDFQQDPSPLVAVDGDRSPMNRIAWSGVGVTALLLGVAAFYGASSAERSGDANRALTFSDPATRVPVEYASVAAGFEEDVRIGERDERRAKGFAIAAGITALASAVLFVVDGSSRRKDAAPAHARNEATEAAAAAAADGGLTRSVTTSSGRLPRPTTFTAAQGRGAAAPGTGLGLAWSF